MNMKTAPRHEYRDLEKLGFLCRWTLLALAVLVILTVTWAGLAGTIAISSDLGTNILLSDAVWRQGTKSPSVHGFLDNLTPKPEEHIFVYRDHLGRQRFSGLWLKYNEIVASLPSAPAGTHQVTLKGLPYGPAAFTQHQATLRIVPDPETVYLLDARFLAKVQRNNEQTAIRIAKEFSRLGQPVLLFPQQRELREDLMARLDLYGDMPGVFSMRKTHSTLPALIAEVSKQLISSDKNSKYSDRKPYVITGDLNTAIETAGMGHYTHLVGSENTPPNLPSLIRLHATSAKLAIHLAAETPVLPANEPPVYQPIP
jgi:hypothetical protein